MMVDMVTKQPLMYQISGATECGAEVRRKAELGTASFPLILNVGGEPTYFMTLKDAEGLIKQYAMVSVSDYSVVGTGETIPAALKDYEQNMANAGKSTDLTVSGKDAAVTGTVERIASEWDGSTMTYKLILKELPDQIFLCSSNLSQELALTMAGDSVKLEYTDYNSGINEAKSFDNLQYTQSASQQ
ncbi:MAG: hypothetical protein ACLRVT_07455 [Oscillospiraceae bacterium]